MKRTIFISYSRTDSRLARKVERLLRELGLEYFLDEKHISLGDRISTKIREGIGRCSILLVIVSRSSLKSHWVAYELGHAAALRKEIIPLLTNSRLRLPAYLADLNHTSSLRKLREYLQQISDPRTFVQKPHDSRLELVDVSFEPPDKERRFCFDDTLDIKVQNVGKKVAYIKSATVVVSTVWELHPVRRKTARVDRSGTYDVKLPIKKTPYELVVPISQAVAANDVDRFGFKIAIDDRSKRFDSDHDYLFQIHVRLCYDSDSKVIETGDLLFATNNPLNIYRAGWMLGGRIPGNVRLASDHYIMSKRRRPHAVVTPGMRKDIRYSIAVMERNMYFVHAMAGIRAIKNSAFRLLMHRLTEATKSFERSLKRLP